SVRSPIAVEPVRSQNSTVTTFRTSRAETGASAAPQPGQKTKSSGLSRPHCPHVITRRVYDPRRSPLTISERGRSSFQAARGYSPAQVPLVQDVDHIVANRYRLREQLGRGGMGVVWRARDERLGREIALKVLHSWVADDPELRARFEREASALARLEHPNVVRLYDVLEDKKQTVLVLELVHGRGLHTIAAGRTLGWDDARRYCAPVAAGLAHAHARGVVHRDLTPSNVLVENGMGRVVVTDFGLARLVRSSTSAPVSGVLAGTPEYWAPEQAAGEATGPATDLYA